jgi:endogenous inhibitor of DNA gyrase (YacG/DUF329 family)
MSTPDELERERQKALIEKRCKLIELGKLKSGELLPGDQPITLNLPPRDICPSCGDKMQWFKRRQAFLCLRCQTT